MILLYHYTCQHGFNDISKSGRLLPNKHPFMPHLGPLLWLTDLERPTPESVGLTSEWQPCDRLAYRYIVRSKAAIHWHEIRKRANPVVVGALEAFGDPAHWWVIRRPVLPSEFTLDTEYHPSGVLADTREKR